MLPQLEAPKFNLNVMLTDLSLSVSFCRERDLVRETWGSLSSLQGWQVTVVTAVTAVTAVSRETSVSLRTDSSERSQQGGMLLLPVAGRLEPFLLPGAGRLPAGPGRWAGGQDPPPPEQPQVPIPPHWSLHQVQLQVTTA